MPRRYIQPIMDNAGGGYKSPHSTRSTALQPKSIPSRATTSYNSYGNTTDQIRDLQRRLGITVDGIYGPQTQQAVRDYQRRMGLTVDGIAGPATWNALRGGSTSSSSSGSSKKSSSSSSAVSSQPFNWVEQLKKQMSSAPKGPKLPDQIDLDQYRTEIATIEDIAKKYGFDYSREYAERQAEAIAQSQRDQIATARERAAWETERAQENLEHDFFQQYLQQRQQLADTGLNAGIAAERDLRLGMNRQHAMADILANAQLYNQELDRRSSTIEQEALAYADRLYNERLAQGFSQAMDYTQLQRQENQAMLNAALQQRQQQVEEAWREFEWNNMSAAERARLIADAEKFGMEMAWRRHEFEAGLAFQAGSSPFNESGKGGGAGNFTQYRVTSGFGPRKAPTKGASSNHKGIDFATPMNTPIGTTTGGTVVHAGSGRGFGNYVAVRDNQGYVHIYAHLNNMNVKVGQKVSAGQIIGRSGATGVATGPHLHYEVRKGGLGGTSVNPTPWL